MTTYVKPNSVQPQGQDNFVTGVVGSNAEFYTLDVSRMAVRGHVPNEDTTGDGDGSKREYEPAPPEMNVQIDGYMESGVALGLNNTTITDPKQFRMLFNQGHTFTGVFRISNFDLDWDKSKDKAIVRIRAKVSQWTEEVKACD